jgi:hypothetical protein
MGRYLGACSGDPGGARVEWRCGFNEHGEERGRKKKGREKHEQKVENMTISGLKRITKMGYGVMDNEFGLNKAIVLGAYDHVPPT